MSNSRQRGKERRFVTEYTRDYYGGALMVLIGLGTAYQGSRYGLGTLTPMKSGFFPVAVGVILALLGLAFADDAALCSSGPHD